MNPPLHIVYFKRDLRTLDHAPLYRAAAAASADQSAVLPLYLIEPSLLSAPDFAGRHYTFIRQSLIELRHRLATLGSPLVVRTSEAVSAFTTLLAKFDVRAVYAHEETGNHLTYQRDRALRRLFQQASIPFHEYPQSGVVRRLRSRTGWAQNWEARMAQPVIPEPEYLPAPASIPPGPIPTHQDLNLHPDTLLNPQSPGPAAAHDTLHSFLNTRGHRYHAEISSPLTAEHSCSRLSPYLAYGNLSMKQVIQTTRKAPAHCPSHRRALRAFDSRLHWHCHFIQKLESQPDIEFHNFIRHLDGLREPHFNQSYFDAWATGHTGYPMIDAAMRMLIATGWINFRMRAMLISFAAYDLFLHWRQPALHLARLFTDYEPGIHYPQCQMQSGTTGINTLRTYCPTKQQLDHDPTGHFVRRWIPELARLPLPCLFEPWKTPAEIQRSADCVIGQHYPAPIVNHKLAVATARQRIHTLRQSLPARQQADQVQAQHGSKKSGLRQIRRPRSKPTPSVPSLFDQYSPHS